MAPIVSEAQQIPKKLGRFESALALYTVDFPLFFIESISERHVVIAGGGGSSKTGVHNQINVLELIPNGDSCAAKRVMKYQTPKEIPDAIMAGALLRDVPLVDTRLVSGGTNATIYQFCFDPLRMTFNISDYETLNDSKTRAELKTVKYTPGRIFTGGIDGHLTSWNVDDKRVDKEVDAHSKEIDDIDVDTVNQRIVTLSRGEGRLVVWNLNTLEKIKEVLSKSLNKPAPSSAGPPAVNYIFRSSRFAYDPAPQRTTKAPDVCLLVASNPVPAKNYPSKIYKMQSSKDEEYKLISTGQPSVEDSIMAMTVSLDGKYVAVGTRSGGVGVLEVKNLRNIYTINGAHHNAVTDLEFLPPKPESLTLTNSRSCPLLSVSIDRRVVLHRPKTQSTSTRFLKAIFIVLVIYLLFYVLHSHYDILSFVRLD